MPRPDDGRWHGRPGKELPKLTKTAAKDKFAASPLILEYFKDGVSTDRVEVCSGAPSKQNFRIGSKSIAKSMEPLAEGNWFVHNIEWATVRTTIAETERTMGSGQ